jgi:hypothetical protein
MRLRKAIPFMLFFGLFSLPPSAQAQNGFDLFTTPGGGETYVMVPTPGGNVRVTLQGNPGPLINKFKSLEGTNVDTIVKRIGPPSAAGVVPIELVALSLQSIAPVAMGGSMFDLEVRGGRQMVCFEPPDDLCPPPPPNPSGQMIIGGTGFTSQLPVQAQIALFPHGGPREPAFVMSFFDVFFSEQGQFSTEPTLRDPRGSPTVAQEFPARGFYPGGAGSPPLKVAVVEVAPSAVHVAIPANTVGPSVLTCFYECKDTAVAGDTLLQETTTLMILNQNREDPALPISHLAHVIFFDGNEHALARVQLPLSGRDLDELHVCKTLDRQTVPGYQGPPAGLVKIGVIDRRAQTPLAGAPDPARVGEGVVAWIKDILGKFDMAQPEPFGTGNTVIGLGKTRCELADPKLIDATDIIRLLPDVPVVPPVLVEQTNEAN